MRSIQRILEEHINGNELIMILNDAATELKSAKIVKKMTKNKHKLHKPGSPRRLEHWQDGGGFDPPPPPPTML